MRDAVVCEPIRTPVGGFGGSLQTLKAHELGATVIRALIERTGLAPGEVDDVIFGSCYPNGRRLRIGRVVGAGRRPAGQVPGLQLDRRCGSACRRWSTRRCRSRPGRATWCWRAAPRA